jgi:F0F1-type ATP synthase gamma subunit
MRVKKVLALAVLITFLLPLVSFAARLSEPEELDKMIKKISERQSKNLKQFDKKTKAYFFEAQTPETIEGLIKEFAPGDTITIIVFSNLSKKPVREIVAMKKAGTNWPDMAGKLKINLKAAVKEVKDFRLGIG